MVTKIMYNHFGLLSGKKPKKVLKERYLMSSFNLNGPLNNMPQITGAQQMKNNGGGGNTGYLGSDNKKKKKKEKEIDPEILGDIEDKFERNKDTEDDYDDYDDYYGNSSSAENNEAVENAEDDEDSKQSSKINVKDTVFGLIKKVTKKDGTNDKGDNKKNPPDDPFGGDFLTLSGK